MRTSVGTLAGLPSSGRDCRNCEIGVAFCQAASSSLPSIAIAASRRAAGTTGTSGPCTERVCWAGKAAARRGGGGWGGGGGGGGGGDGVGTESGRGRDGVGTESTHVSRCHYVSGV